MNRLDVGWDIGGAHVKAAIVNDNGGILGVFQEQCPLWQGMERLENAVNRILAQLPGRAYRHAVTMTGELADLFASREDGVRRIIEAMSGLLGKSEILIYAGPSGFLHAGEVDGRHLEAIASANWLASATYAAKKLGSGLFVDIGSTTTDILLLDRGRVLAEGYTDHQRLISKELIYTGIVRTSVMALTQTALDRGREVGVMAEYFATLADVYRVTGELDERHDQYGTADGAEKTVTASARRLSRMIGCDFDADELPRWRQFAEHLRSRQVQQIQHGCERQLSRLPLAKSSPFIGAGIGRFLVRQLARNLGYGYQDFTDLFIDIANEPGLAAADCAPAVAVASLVLETSRD
ncbi:MAG: hydantoinase/oxoprolinase family protein [Gammaproteobacteria bacterium]